MEPGPRDWGLGGVVDVGDVGHGRNDRKVQGLPGNPILEQTGKKGTEISDATRYTIIMYCTYIIVHLDQEYISEYSNMYRHI